MPTPQYQSYARAGHLHRRDAESRRIPQRQRGDARGHPRAAQGSAEEALKLDKLRVSIKQGVAALDRGDYTEVEDEDLDAYLDALATPGRP